MKAIELATNLTLNNNFPNFKKFDVNSRSAALSEAHARPPIEFGMATQLRHFAFQAEEKALEKLHENLKSADNDKTKRLAIGRIDSLTVKLEQHTEFYTCTIFDQNPKRGRSLVALDELLATDEFILLSDVLISIHENQLSLIKDFPLAERQLGGIMRGGMEVRTTLKVDKEGVQRIAVLSGKMSGHEFGRRIQRLLEMETYRILTLLGLEAARSSSSELSRLESRVDQLLAMEKEDGGAGLELGAKLTDLSAVSASLNALRAATRYRFSASQAYYDLVVQRLKSLEEEKTGDIQTLTGFVRSRLDPAIATIKSVEKRLSRLSQEIDSALSLLRTQIDVELNQSNQKSLLSLNRRHRQQLLISQTVEGLSVVAISYYAVGLLSYVAKAFKEQNYLPVSETSFIALSVPFVCGLVWLFIWRLRKHWDAK